MLDFTHSLVPFQAEELLNYFEDKTPKNNQLCKILKRKTIETIKSKSFEKEVESIIDLNNKIKALNDEYREIKNQIEEKKRILKATNPGDPNAEVEIKKYKEEIAKLIRDKSSVRRDKEEVEHQRFVNVCLQPTGFKNGNHKVYAMIVPLEEDDSSNFIDCDYKEYHISLLTPAMAYTDYIYFFNEFNEDNKPWWHKYYRPYYYELWIKVNKNDAQWKELYEYSLELGLFKASIFPAGTKDSEEPENGSYSGILHWGGSATGAAPVTFKISWLNRLKIDNSKKYQIKNMNSKMKKKYQSEKKLVIEKKIKEIKNRINNATDCREALDPFFDSLSNKKVEIKTNILNVGNANCIHFDMGKGSTFMFDVGIPFEKYSPPKNSCMIDNTDFKSNAVGNIRNSLGLIKKYNPKIIISSHYHYDHVIGFVHMSNKALDDSIWITPMIDDEVNDLTCLRLALYKACHGKLIVIKDNYGKCVYSHIFNPNNNNSDNYIKLYRGEKGDLNDSGLMLLIKNGKKALFSADCRYGHWPNAAVLSQDELKDVNYFVAPHHGSNYKTDYSILSNFTANDREAIVCCGCNGYNHPSPEHLHQLSVEYGFKTHLTGGTLESKISTNDNKEYKYEYTDGSGNIESVEIERGNIKFTL